MILEVAILSVKKGLETKFEADFKKASRYISAIDGYLNHKLKKCMEQSHKYILLVEWRDLGRPYHRIQTVRELSTLEKTTESLLRTASYGRTL